MPSKLHTATASHTPSLSGSLVWLRRDLRVTDHAALAQACALSGKVYVVFVFDRDILDALESKQDRRVEFIWECVASVKAALIDQGGDLIVLHGSARAEIVALAKKLEVAQVICATDYEPSAVERDRQVAEQLDQFSCDFIQVKDQVIFEKQEVLTQAQKPFSVFTPYKNAWLKRLGPHDLAEHVAELEGRIAKPAFGTLELPTLESMGFERTNLKQLKIPLAMQGGEQLFSEFIERMGDYGNTRDFPAVKGPSYLSVHLRFGTVSIRKLAVVAHQKFMSGDESSEGSSRWLFELIWRDFYFQILANFPHVVDGAFKAEYNAIPWDNNPQLFQAWCEGKTGFPLVDAAMLQLNQTGYMHNRLRMVVASFLTKDLGIDWRWGERYFAKTLNDFDLSANNGGWQWAASSGCDAQPYFRIFNPTSQSEKFDPEGVFIKRYLPKLKNLNAKHIHAPWECPPLSLAAAEVTLGVDYPMPVVQHDVERKKTLARYEVVKKIKA